MLIGKYTYEISRVFLDQPIFVILYLSILIERILMKGISKAVRFAFRKIFEFLRLTDEQV